VFNVCSLFKERAKRQRHTALTAFKVDVKPSHIARQFGFGHTDGVGGDAFNKKLSKRRVASIKQYLVDNFHLSAGNLRTVGYGKTRPKNKTDPNAPENRRVEVVSLAPQAQASR
jgi:hypothetical protein